MRDKSAVIGEATAAHIPLSKQRAPRVSSSAYAKDQGAARASAEARVPPEEVEEEEVPALPSACPRGDASDAPSTWRRL